MDANGLHASFCSLSGCRTTCNLALVSTSVTVFHFRRELPIPERISPRLSHLVKPNPFGSATTLAGESGAASFTLPQVSYVAPQVAGPQRPLGDLEPIPHAGRSHLTADSPPFSLGLW